MSPIATSISPVNPKKRFEVIDIIRGFALFGVLVANMLWTSQHFALTDAQREALPLAHINEWISWSILTLVEFKFYTLFSMLFGLGFAMQLESAKNKNINILPVFRKRLFILLLIGIAHATLLWFGDILHVYALLGFLLILFRNVNNSTLIKWIIGLALLSGLLPFLSWLAFTASAPLNNPENYDLIKAMRFERLTSSHWIDVVHLNTHWNLEEYKNIHIGSDGTIYWNLNVFWKFLLGFYIGRNQILQKAKDHLGRFKKYFIYGGIIGLIGCLAWSTSLFLFDIWLPSDESPLSITSVFLEFSILALSMSYLSAIVLLYFKTDFRKHLSLLAPLGRMALTNYLMQSACMAFIFYGVGFQLLGKIGSLYCLLSSLVVFVLQILFSKWWLSKFQFGPFEWLWRSLTYGKRQPFRITS